MLSDLYMPFSIVGLTEIKLKVDQSFLSNIEIPGYSFSFQPSLSNAGGVGFYIKEDQLFTTRPDLTLSTDDFETLWVEMQNGSHRNIICGVIYRHPHGNMQNLMDFLNSTIEKIDRENKFCIILGDFNLDLLDSKGGGGQLEISCYFGHHTHSVIFLPMTILSMYVFIASGKALIPRAFPFVILGGVVRCPGIGWSCIHLHPEILDSTVDKLP